MYTDSCIAEHVMGHFIKMGVPILCVHDSFVVPYDQVLELRATMVEAGNLYANRFLFHDKNGEGFDEWFAQYENTGDKPAWEPKSVVRCKGYSSRIHHSHF